MRIALIFSSEFLYKISLHEYTMSHLSTPDTFRLFPIVLDQMILIDFVKVPSKIRDHFTIFPTRKKGKLPFSHKSATLDISKIFIFATQVNKNKVATCGGFNLHFLTSLCEGEHLYQMFFMYSPFCESHVYIISLFVCWFICSFLIDLYGSL